MSACLWVTGTLTLDTIEADAWSLRDVPGGSALYAAAAARCLLPARILGVVGTDFPTAQMEALSARGVDFNGVSVVEGPSFRWHARYEADGRGRVTLARDPGVSAHTLPPPPSMVGPHDAVLMASTAPSVQAHVLAGLGGSRPVGLDSMAHWWRDHRSALIDLLEQVDVVFVSEDELELATGSSDAGLAARRVWEWGPHTLVVRRGPRGAWMGRRDRSPLQTTAVKLRDVRDPTGAGDAFAGAFMAALALGEALGDGYVLRLATAAASYAIEAPGVEVLARAELSDLQRRMDRLVVNAG